MEESFSINLIHYSFGDAVDFQITHKRLLEQENVFKWTNKLRKEYTDLRKKITYERPGHENS